ncbi:glycosyltransferase family 4 protein [Chitinophaga nivalis]|uniref:Glycosyltransferase family 4 protein n=1 Tax=Chitinophaga nivalis TaxID=2991709 RepID=A0ABT3IQP1_9BACT|nr:glycosyltransferase family 1 protein [Chitinophaga nivalis]MCW3464022.1 glycosyltransferase family 4 protein [Chitinophaga nivalis]MCW3486288.1 glycosyltransferase family 4 protein [Chitinophaga nivalis]
MKIGFDAKRAYQNNTGLGNYSRTLISSLVTGFPEHHYYLFAPKQTDMFTPGDHTNLEVVGPEKTLHRWFKSAWRSRYVVKDLQRYGIGLYHGLSHELPFGIHKSGIRSVVTMHDLIFERYPEQYNPIDVITYRRKARYACRYADRVVAISEQTRQDLITYYQTPADKIDVVYQSCDPAFAVTHTPEEIAALRTKYGLPAQYFLYVGSIIERKNLLGIVTAMHTLKGDVSLPLVVLGSGSSYKKKVKAYLAAHGLEQQVIWLNEQARLPNRELPLLYQGAAALLYPSVFEGFGIPILEALWSRTPVITSSGSCFGETGGDAALYVDPLQPAAIAAAMKRVVTEPELVKEMKEKGRVHAALFTPEKCAAAMMKVYEALK